jgi:hypothetical protein
MKATVYLSVALLLWCNSFILAQRQPVHLWTFDEGSGTEAADVVGGQAGLVNGATWTTGQIGGALKFDGVDDYVALPDNDPVWLPTGSFTVSFWVYFDRDRGRFVATRRRGTCGLRWDFRLAYVWSPGISSPAIAGHREDRLSDEHVTESGRVLVLGVRSCQGAMVPHCRRVKRCRAGDLHRWGTGPMAHMLFVTR